MNPLFAGTSRVQPLFPFQHPLGASPRRIWVFPGQGSQKVGMGLDYYQSSPTYKSIVDQGCDVLWKREKDDQGRPLDLRKIIFEGPSDLLTKTYHAQPALLISSNAFFDHLRREEGIGLAEEDLTAGHSLGEWSAYVATNSLTLEQGALATYWRGRFFAEAFPFEEGVRPMTAIIGLPDEVVIQGCQEVFREGAIVVPANFNCPGQVVISGHPHAVGEAARLLKSRGATINNDFPVGGPFHTPLLQEAGEKFEAKLSELGITFAAPSHLIISNFTGREIAPDGDHLRSLINQITGSVRWVASMIRGWELGAIQMVSVDVAGNTLLGFAKRIFSRDVPVQSVDPRIPMYRNALRAPVGTSRVTTFSPAPAVTTARLLESSYDVGAIAKKVKELMETGRDEDRKLALTALDNPYLLSREAGLRQLKPYTVLSDENDPTAVREILDAIQVRDLTWPAEEVRDLPTQPLPPETQEQLKKEIFPALEKQKLAPVDEETLLYFVSSRWAGNEEKLKAILQMLGRLTRLNLLKLKLISYGPPGEEKKGIDSWEKVMLYVDYSKEINFVFPGSMRLYELFKVIPSKIQKKVGEETQEIQVKERLQEIYADLCKLPLGLDPAQANILFDYVGSRWRGSEQELEKILGKLRELAGLKPDQLQSLPYTPKPYEKKGVDSWEKIVLFIDHSIGFSFPGYLKVAK